LDCKVRAGSSPASGTMKWFEEFNPWIPRLHGE